MGVTVYAYSEATPVDGDEHICALKPGGAPERWCADEDHKIHWAYAGFEQSLDGLEVGRCHILSGERASSAGHSYGGYGIMRSDISMAILGVKPEVVWENVDYYRDKPFFEMIHFADNEGSIGPRAAHRLYEDFVTHRDSFMAYLATVEHPGYPKDFHEKSYDAFTEVFRVGATGMVVYG